MLDTSVHRFIFDGLNEGVEAILDDLSRVAYISLQEREGNREEQVGRLDLHEFQPDRASKEELHRIILSQLQQRSAQVSRGGAQRFRVRCYTASPLAKTEPLVLTKTEPS